MLLLRNPPNANYALKTGRGDWGARGKTVRIARRIPLVFNTDLGPAAPSGHNETSKPGDTGHLVLPATNERRERRLLILGVDLIKRLQAPYTVHERSRSPFRIGVQLRVHAGLPLENLTDKPAVDVATGDARQKSSRFHPLREGDFDGPTTSVLSGFRAGYGHPREAAPLDRRLLRIRLAGGKGG